LKGLLDFDFTRQIDYNSSPSETENFHSVTCYDMRLWHKNIHNAVLMLSLTLTSLKSCFPEDRYAPCILCFCHFFITLWSV